MPTELPTVWKKLSTKPIVGAKSSFAYNEANGITPQAIIKGERNALGKQENAYVETEHKHDIAADPVVQYMSKPALEKAIARTKRLCKMLLKNSNSSKLHNFVTNS